MSCCDFACFAVQHLDKHNVTGPESWQLYVAHEFVEANQSVAEYKKRRNMKKVFLGTLFVLISTLAFGQTVSGSFAGLAACGKAKFAFDFSEASIHGMSEEEFECYEPDWSKDLPEIKGDFVNEVIDRLNGLVIIGSNVKSDYSIIVQVISISRKGDYVCDVIIKEGEEEVAWIQGVKADGGTFGTKLNLIKDGAEHTGKQLGRILYREIKKAKKSR